MWRVSLRDLQWRRRRFAIAVTGTSLVFAMTLVLAGFSASFRDEAATTVGGVGAGAWVMNQSASGPFSTVSVIPGGTAELVRREPGVTQADPIVIFHQTTHRTSYTDINMIGHRLGGLGTPPLTHGRQARGDAEAVVDESLGARIGEDIVLAGTRFKVVGLTHGSTIDGGIPNVFTSLAASQKVALGGAPSITAVVVRGLPQRLPAGLKVISNADVREDVLRPLSKAIRVIDILQYMLWLVAACIVGSVVYLSAMERVRDFAVLKATGASSRSLLGGVALQAVILALGAAAMAEALARILPALFPIAVSVPIAAALALPVIAVMVGLVSSVSGVRRALAVDPASAFGGP